MASCSNHKQVSQLALVKSYDVITHDSIEPSGLTLWDGEFYTVSDKHNFIYQLIFSENSIELKPIIEITNDKDFKLDFEGITHDKKNFYIISEMHFQILKISKDGQNQSWLPSTDKLKTAGIAKGLFTTRNANFEGICFMQNNKYLMAAERQPRGFVTFDGNTNQVIAYQVNNPVFEYQNDRSPDFTGLSCDDEIYVLDRNADTVAKLKLKNGQYQEGRGYSYSHIINKPELQYQDMKYGQAEGLVVKGNKVYIILDNNRNPHSQNPSNTNSLFLELEK